MKTSFIPNNDRPVLALLARLSDDQASNLLLALNTASEGLSRADLLVHVVNNAQSVESNEIKDILRTVRQIAVAKENLEVSAHVFAADVAEEMGKIEEDGFRLDQTEQIQLKDRLTVLTETTAIEFYSKTRSLRQDRENGYCRARIITDLRPVFGSDVYQSPKAVLVMHTLRITYHHGHQGKLQDLFLTLRSTDLDNLSELIERAKSKAESLDAFSAAADLKKID